MVNMKSPVLLLGYNRPEYIKTRLIEIMSWDPTGIYINIDGPKNENDSRAYKEINDFLLNYKNEKILLFNLIRKIWVYHITLREQLQVFSKLKKV